MKFNQIIFITTLLFSSFLCFSSEKLSIDHYEKKFRTQLKKEKFKEQLRDISNAWKNYDPQKRIKLDPKIYILIQEKFSNEFISSKSIDSIPIPESICTTPNINTETEKNSLSREIAYLEETKIKKREMYKEMAMFYKVQSMILNNILNQNNPSKNQHINQNQNINSTKKRKMSSIPKQLYNARKILFNEYNVKDEFDLKQILLDHAIEYENQNISNFISDTISGTNCSFIFCGKCQFFKIFHNTNTNNKSFCNNCLEAIQNKKKRKPSFNTSSSCDDLKINVKVLPQ